MSDLSLIQAQFRAARVLCERQPVVSVTDSFKRTAKELTNPQAPSLQTVIQPVLRPTENQKSAAQVARLVLPQAVLPNAGGLKPKGNTTSKTRLVPQKKRPSPLTLRVSEAQKEILQRKAQTAGVPVGRYVLATALGADYKPPVPPTIVRALLALVRELTAQGNNPNQIAKQLNTRSLATGQGESLLDSLGRSILRTLHSVRQALANGVEP